MSNNQGNAPEQSLTVQAKESFARIQAACPEDGAVLGRYLAAIHQKNVIALGDGEAFVLTDAEGRSIKATKRTVHLSAENGGLTQPVWQGPYVISAPGYSMLAHTAGAVVMNAPTVIVDGVEQQNPFVRRGPDGTIIEVHCRAMAFRYNENGQPMVSDRTTIFDTATYALADMVGKAKRMKDAFKLLPSAVPAPIPPEEWACYRVDDAVNLWMKITHAEVINFLGQVLNRKKKALEFAQTFAQRNALKHLFGIAVVPGQGSGQNCNPISQWDVPVVCWAPSDGGLIRFDTSRYAVSTKVIEALSVGRPVALPEAKEPLVVSRGTDDVHGGDMDEEADPLENPDRYENQESGMVMSPPIEEPAVAASDTEQPQEEPTRDWTAEELKAWKNLHVARENFPDEYATALADCGLTDEEVSPGNAAEINLAISSMLDAQ
ncbi:hypothetical protein HMPREF1022_02893 [Desulfovibrio sp. 6_1_46AFAA]|uniref:hypothetical protein n=1 Tax=Desulfovibrio sp. 6_1_46AFAA TaxID=665942 RepID=UPI0002236D50|nr:hypothetical protein [Desulfovibrio sp. 6_1_46AFAA]EGW50071.1 hypothetical protein HMPREF1022_02893 [Desulfovibrio sp. 6_1_46AFAA]